MSNVLRSIKRHAGTHKSLRKHHRKPKVRVKFETVAERRQRRESFNQMAMAMAGTQGVAT